MNVPELHELTTDLSRTLNDIDSKQLLHTAGLTVAETRAATFVDDAVAAVKALGLPVVLKPLPSEAIPAQWPDSARVLANSEAEVRSSFETAKARIRALNPAAGLAVQKAVRPGVDLRIHVFQDSVLGAAVAFSFGRMAADIWEDVAYRILPLVEKDARLMVREPKAAKVLLRGYGVLAAPNAAHIEDLLLKLSALMESAPDLIDIEIDAVAGRESVIVQEARITLRPTQ